MPRVANPENVNPDALRCFIVVVQYPETGETSYVVKQSQNEAINAYVDALKQDAHAKVYRVRSSRPQMDSAA